MSSVIHIDGCHLCKSPYPRDAMTVDARTNSVRSYFRGRFDITIHAVFSKSTGAEPGADETGQIDISSQLLFRIPPVMVCRFAMYTIT